MALPLSGTVSMNDIRIELGIPTQSPFSLTSASTGSYVAINQCSTYKPNASAPYAISEWYGYCHTCACWSGNLSTGTTCANACLFLSATTYYSDCYTPDVGCHFYSGPGLTNPAPDGYYSDGTYCYNVGDAPGYILSKTSCATPTPTATVTQTPTPTHCDCVCGFSVQNDNAFSITVTWLDCYGTSLSGTANANSTFVVACGDPASNYTKYGSVVAVGASSITYGSCITAPTPTPTVTPSQTMTPTITPTITTTKTVTPTNTVTPTKTPTVTPTGTPSSVPPYNFTAYLGGDSSTCLGGTPYTLYSYSPFTGFVESAVYYDSFGTPFNGGNNQYVEANFCTYATISTVGVASSTGICLNCV